MRQTMKTLITILFLLVSSVAYGEQIISIVEEAVLYHVGECNAIYEEEGYFTVVDTEEMKYLLCEPNKEVCDSFTLERIEESGVFTIYTTGVGGAVLKIANEEGDLFGFKKDQFIEVRHKFRFAFLSWGSCKKR